MQKKGTLCVPFFCALMSFVGIIFPFVFERMYPI